MSSEEMEVDQHLMSPLPGCRIIKIPLEIFFLKEY